MVIEFKVSDYFSLSGFGCMEEGSEVLEAAALAMRDRVAQRMERQIKKSTGRKVEVRRVNVLTSKNPIRLAVIWRKPSKICIWEGDYGLTVLKGKRLRDVENINPDFILRAIEAVQAALDAGEDDG